MARVAMMASAPHGISHGEQMRAKAPISAYGRRVVEDNIIGADNLAAPAWQITAHTHGDGF